MTSNPARIQPKHERVLFIKKERKTKSAVMLVELAHAFNQALDKATPGPPPPPVIIKVICWSLFLQTRVQPSERG